MKIVHIITGLGTGGAEIMLYKVIKSWPDPSDQHWVISISDKGVIGPRIESLNIPITTLRMSPGHPTLRGIFRYISEIRKIAPDLVQGWMYHGNLAASFARKILPRRPVILWNIRQTLIDIKLEKTLTRFVIYAGERWAHQADAIIYNSEASHRQHVAYGFSDKRSLVIPNGFDLHQLRPDKNARQRLRDELGIAPDVPVVGMIARFHPMKDHANFFDAAKQVAEINSEVVFVLAGRDVNYENEAVVEMAGQLTNGRVHLLGERSDIPELMNIFDVVCTSSAWGEAFPNVLGEAMASGIPCVATDVGDSAHIIGDTGRIVPIRDSSALATAILDILSLNPEQRRELCEQARHQIERRFSIEAVVDDYRKLYQQLSTEHGCQG